MISAGVKSILDIPRTLEYLVDIIFFYPVIIRSNSNISALNIQETQGICVAAYKTSESPAFFMERSGCKGHPFSWLTFSFQAPSDFNLQNVKMVKSVWFVAMYTHFLGLHHLTTFCLRKKKEKRKCVFKGTLTGLCGVRCLGSPPRIRNLDQIDHIG